MTRVESIIAPNGKTWEEIRAKRMASKEKRIARKKLKIASRGEAAGWEQKQAASSLSERGVRQSSSAQDGTASNKVQRQKSQKGQTKAYGTFKWKERICRQCGARFTNVNPLRFCSPKCRAAFQAKRRQRVCKQCGESFEVARPCLGVKYCSRKCMGVGMRLNETKDCTHCGKQFKLRSARDRKRRKFCSNTCARSHAVGQHHPCWRGNRRADRGTSWPSARDAARQRDTVCVSCGAAPAIRQKLSVDHIVPFRLALEYFQAIPIGPAPNDLTNLACLCRSCHAKKTGTENRLLRGDLVGFIQATKAIIPLERVEAALKLWGLQ